MVTPEQVARYRKSRHNGVPALHAFRWAKATPTFQFEWDGNGSHGTLERDGITLVAKIEDDYDFDFEDEYGRFEPTWSSPIVRGSSTRINGFENPEWRRRAYDNGPGSRTDPDDRYFYTSSGETFEGLLEWYRTKGRTGMSRHTAWLAARERMLEMLGWLQQAHDNNPPWDHVYAQVTAYVGEDIEVCSFGYSTTFDRDYAAPLDPQLDETVADAAHECWAGLLEGMKATIKRLAKDKDTVDGQLATIERMVSDQLWLH